MPSSEESFLEPRGISLHATAVSVGGAALLIIGPSGSGKSRLAIALIAASTATQPIQLIGDDRVLIAPGRRGLVVRPHPRIAGFVERRGLGIVALPFVPVAPLGGTVLLGPTTMAPPLAQNLPTFRYVQHLDPQVGPVLDWWRCASTTPRAKAACGRAKGA